MCRMEVRKPYVMLDKAMKILYDLGYKDYLIHDIKLNSRLTRAFVRYFPRRKQIEKRYEL